MVIDHYEPLYHTSETRTGAGKTTVVMVEQQLSTGSCT